MQALRVLSNPLSVIKLGGFPYLLLVIGSMASITYGLDIIYRASVLALDPIITEHTKEVISTSLIYFLLYISYWIICLPFILIVVAYPIRVIALHKRLSALEFFKELPKAFICSVSGTWWMLKLLPYYCASLIALVVIYPRLEPYITSKSLLYVFIFAAFIVFILALRKLVTAFMMPTIATLGLYEAYYADSVARPIFDQESAALTTLGFITIAGSIVIYLSLPGDDLYWVRCYLLVSFCTYMLMSFSVFLIDILADIERKMSD